MAATRQGFAGSVMSGRMTPMIHVPNVRESALWYQAIGFALEAWHGCDADGISHGPLSDEIELDWALLRWGHGELMLNTGGFASNANRRDVDLYIHLGPDARVDDLFQGLSSRADVVEPPYNAFHGARELIIRDLNGFWITFAEPVAGRDSDV